MTRNKNTKRSSRRRFLKKVTGETVAPIEIAHRSISLAHLGNIALMLRRDLRWDPKKEKFVDDPGANLLLNRACRAPWVLWQERPSKRV